MYANPQIIFNIISISTGDILSLKIINENYALWLEVIRVLLHFDNKIKLHKLNKTEDRVD